MEDRIEQSLGMVEAFASVGVERFDVCVTTIDQEKVRYYSGLNAAALKFMLPRLVPLSWELRENLILRPRAAPGVALAQLDDLDERLLGRMRSRAFLTLETSPGNYQAWLAILRGSDDLIRRLVKGLGVDWNASRSVRMAGTPNCKRKYLPNLPEVTLDQVQPMRIVKPVDVEADLAPAQVLPLVVVTTLGKCRPLPGSTRGWPDYERCLRGAPMKPDGSRDRSRADFMWAKWALERGNTPASVIGKLLRVSPKARWEWKRGNGAYAVKTVESAGRAVR